MPKARDPRKPPKRRVRLARPSKAERDQAEELAGRHPWQLTYGEFLRRAASEYGFALHQMEFRDRHGKTVGVQYLKSLDGKSVVPLPALKMDEVLDEFVTASLCRRLGIPPEHWGLDPEPDDSEK